MFSKIIIDPNSLEATASDEMITVNSVVIEDGKIILEISRPESDLLTTPNTPIWQP